MKPTSPSADNGTRDAPEESTQTAVPDKQAIVTPESSTVKASADSSAGEPTDLEGFLRRGHDRAVHGNFELARRDFDEVIRRDPGHAGALDDRCWVLAMLDEVQTALKDCDASLQAAPNFADALDSRGFVNLKLGFYQKAIADYSAALSQFRGAKRATALYGRGIAKRRSGNATGAKSDIAAAKAIRSTIADEFASYGIQ
jgi:tetratricopeptide (TPR) repeat protein